MAFDLQIGAWTIFAEASGEPAAGQRAVAHVLVNRLKTGKWGHTLAAVCLSASQFSSWNNGDPNRERVAETPDYDATLVSITEILQAVLNGTDQDNTGGALFYFNPSEVMPDWAADYTKTVSIGNHSFYKP